MGVQEIKNVGTSILIQDAEIWTFTRQIVNQYSEITHWGVSFLVAMNFYQV